MKEYMLKGKRAVSLLAAAGILVFMTGIATAKTAATTKDEKKLSTELAMLDKDASLPQGGQIVMDWLSKEFYVTGDQIRAMLDKNLGYGEIATIYAFADKMPGGITDDNVSKVMSMRQGNAGWGAIAGDLNVDLRSIAGRLDSIEKGVHKDIKKASIAPGATGGAGGGMSDSGSGDIGY
jgi:hypothetical protein